MKTPTDTERIEWIASHLQSLLITIDDCAEIGWITDGGAGRVTKTGTDLGADADLLRIAIDQAMQENGTPIGNQ